ncbi:MAG: hypothetical protein D6763_11325 [Alphaproteobacteria bacterium]|nr:MAG: hypothetical protein D6763_11325 [Alphaproteobacteria bacterium]
MFLSAIATALAFGAGLAGAGSTTSDCVGVTDPWKLYGDRVAFEVRREGRRVGFHETRFDWQGDFLRVTSEMRLTVKFLFVPVYEFRYEAEELWCDDALYTLEAAVNDNGERKAFSVRRHGPQLLIDGDERKTIPGDVVTTNHWNPVVLDDRVVLNTLTGKLNKVEIEPVAIETVETLNGPIEATRYRYSGDLETEAWYDEQGRWVKLRFKARDGSTVEYVCITCDAGEPDTGGQSS